MRRACKFLWVDLLKTRLQVLFMAGFAILGFVMMQRSESSLNGSVYMSFAAVIIATQPFILEQGNETGFLNMLPGSKLSRVLGRYLYGLLLLLLGLALAVAEAAAYACLVGEISDMFPMVLALCAGVGLLFCSVQYVIFYAMGRLKSRQLASIVMMVPGFIMFAGFEALLSLLYRYAGAEWIGSHQRLLAEILIGVSVLIWIAGITVSYEIVKRRDDT